MYISSNTYSSFYMYPHFVYFPWYVYLPICMYFLKCIRLYILYNVHPLFSFYICPPICVHHLSIYSHQICSPYSVYPYTLYASPRAPKCVPVVFVPIILVLSYFDNTRNADTVCFPLLVCVFLIYTGYH